MNAFRDAVRARDRKRVIIGTPNLSAEYNRWISFETDHIFPLAHEDVWIKDDYARWITDMDRRSAAAKINSCQNGLLLKVHIHTEWNSYDVSVNLDVSDFLHFVNWYGM